jgi:hypothetical protein
MSETEEEDEGEVSILDRLKDYTSLFGNIKESGEGHLGGEEDEEFLHSEKKVPFHRSGKEHHIGKEHRHHKHDFNLPELMKYSEYDKKAWNLFKRYQDDI